MPFRLFFSPRSRKETARKRRNRFNRQNRRPSPRRRARQPAPALLRVPSRQKNPDETEVSSGFNTGSRSRTGTPLRAMDFESIASAYSANPAKFHCLVDNAFILPRILKTARGHFTKIHFFSFKFRQPRFLSLLYVRPPRQFFIPTPLDAAKAAPQKRVQEKKNPDETQSLVGV